jgi:Zn-dependent peptidase ImmA (M78 family)
VRPDALEAWEAGEDAPSIPQLRKLAEVYKRPLVVFYLPEPPRDFDALRDFRRLPADVPDESHQLASEIRWAHEMREIALEVYRVMEEPIPELDINTKLVEPVHVAAERLRTALDLQPERIREVTDWYEAYRIRRGALESAGVLCFQITGVNLAEARGFSINLRPFPVVAVNATDAVAARMFTLLHEAAHLALGVAGTCDMHARGSEERDRIEIFCNAVAAEVLVPDEHLRREPEVRGVRGKVEWPDQTVRSLATRYRVSREVIVRRLLDLGLTTPQFYRAKRDEYRVSDVPPEGGGGNFYTSRRVKYGMPVIRGVLGAHEAGKITANEAAAYLRVKVEQLEVMGRA